MWKLQPPPEKSHPLFQNNPDLKSVVLSSHSFLKIWLDVQLSAAEKGGVGAHYGPMMEEVTRKLISLINHN